MNCTICNDTGKRASSDYLDCSCGAAEERAELQAYVDSVGWRAFTTSATISDLMWSIHQRAHQIEREHHAEAVKLYKAQIDDLDQQNTALTNECRGMNAEKEAQAARIAELEAQLTAAPSAPAVEQQKPEHVAYAENGVLHWMTGRKFQNCELYTAPQAADTDKVREAVEAMNRAKLLPIWDNDVPHKLHVELDVIFKALSSMAAQAPVREVPEGREIFGWIIVNKDTREHDGGEVYTDKYEADHYMENRCLPGWQLEPIYRVLPAAPVQQEGDRG